jgi:hypothetical protein
MFLNLAETLSHQIAAGESLCIQSSTLGPDRLRPPCASSPEKRAGRRPLT